MEAESFFERWARGNAEAAAEKQASAPAQEPPKPPPTLEDVARLTHDADFRPFLAQDVDDNVRRLAMKKLFSDPHFNVMDGLDVYIDDYNKFEPLTPQILAALNHAQSLLDPLAHVDNPMQPLLDKTADRAAPDDPQPGAADAARGRNDDNPL